MKTNDLISMLAREPAPIVPNTRRRQDIAVLFASVVVCLLIMMAWLGINPAIAHDAASEPMFWGKFGFSAAAALALLIAMHQLALPGSDAKPGLRAAAIVGGLLAVMGLAAWFRSGASARSEMLFGETWDVCSAYIAALAVPIFIAAFWSVKRYAPTRPALAGFAAGAFSGAAAAVVYGLHCSMYTVPFVAAWYGLGVIVPGLIGAALGSRLLRW